MRNDSLGYKATGNTSQIAFAHCSPNTSLQLYETQQRKAKQLGDLVQ